MSREIKGIQAASLEEISQKLTDLINSFYENRVQFDKYKKITDNENKEIKEIMSERGWSEFSTDDLVAKKSVQERESFNEPALIEKLLEIDAKEAVELVPTINWDKIEDMIYNGKLDPSVLAPYKETKEIVTLKVSVKKGE